MDFNFCCAWKDNILGGLETGDQVKIPRQSLYNYVQNCSSGCMHIAKYAMNSYICVCN